MYFPCLSLTVHEQAIDTKQLTVISHACLKDGVKHSDGLSHTCIEDIASISYIQSPPESVTECQSTFPDNPVCSDACKQTLDLITKSFGCCYYDLANIGMNLTSYDVWTACKREYPKECQ